MSKKPDEKFAFAFHAGATIPRDSEPNHKIFSEFPDRGNYFVIDDYFVVVKISRTTKPFWGVDASVINLLIRQPNFAVVLLQNAKEGYCFTKNEVLKNLNSRWKLRKEDNNYKINMPLPDSLFFKNTDEFLEIAKFAKHQRTEEQDDAFFKHYGFSKKEFILALKS